MDPDAPDEKENGVSTRRVSQMSAEDPESPTSPASDRSDSTIEEQREEYESIRSKSSNYLRPTMSRASSTNAVGNVASPLERSWTGKSTMTNSDPVFEVDFEDNERGSEYSPIISSFGVS